jgi:hypothetical protein
MIGTMPSLLDSYSKMTLRSLANRMKSKTGIWIKKHSILIIVFLSIRTKLIDNAVVKFKMIPAVKGYKQHILETSGPQTGLGLHCWTMKRYDKKQTTKAFSGKSL